MRRCILPALLLALAFSPSGSAQAQTAPKFSQDYDRFEDLGSFELELGTVIKRRTHSVKIDVVRIYSGQPRKGRPGGLKLNLVSDSSDGWEYLDHHPLTLLVDGERMKFEVDHDGTVGKGYVLEHMWADLTSDQAKKIASAKSIEGQLGINEFNLRPDQVAAIREFEALAANPDRPLPTEFKPGGARLRDPEPLIMGRPRFQEPDPSYRPQVGDVALIFLKEDAGILAGPDFETYREMATLISTKQYSELNGLERSQKLLTLTKGTRIRVEAVHEDPDAPNPHLARYVEAKVLEGPHIDTKVWVHRLGVNRILGQPAPANLVTPKERVAKEVEAKAQASHAKAILQLRLAQALERTNPKGALQYYREVVELAAPDSPEAKWAKDRVNALEPNGKK